MRAHHGGLKIVDEDAAGDAMKPFAEALGGPGPLVAAWDYEDNARTKLSLFHVGERGLTTVAQTEVPLDRQEEMVERLVERKIRIGGHYAGSVFAWVVDDQGCSVWTPRTRVAHLGARPTDVVAVTLFVDPADAGHRGVRLTRAGGKDQVLVEERDPTPSIDPAYGHDELFSDSMWARFLADQLAVWLLVPRSDEVSQRSNELDLTIARGAVALAAQLERGGSAERIVQSLGPVGRAHEVAFVAAGPEGLELTVTGVGGTSSVQLKAGTPAQLAAFLRRPGTPYRVQWAVNAQLQGPRPT